jgi:hypothetical protein
MANFDERYRARIRLAALKLALDNRPSREVSPQAILDAAKVFENYVATGLHLLGASDDKKK